MFPPGQTGTGGSRTQGAAQESPSLDAGRMDPREHWDGCRSGWDRAGEEEWEDPILAIRSCGFATVFHFGTKKKSSKRK